MSRKYKLMTLGHIAVATLLLPGCCEDTEPTDPGDTTAPCPVTDLRVISATDSSVTLTWTATGDDGQQGTANRYDLRYSLSTLSEFNFDRADIVPGVASPKPAGETETLIVQGLTVGFTVHFAMKVGDESPNWSVRSPVTTLQWDLPTLLAISPSQGELIAMEEAQVTIQFDRPMDAGSVAAGLYWRVHYTGQRITYQLNSIGAGDDSEFLLLAEAGELQMGEDYRVVLTSRMTDQEGRPFDADPDQDGLQEALVQWSIEPYSPLRLVDMDPPPDSDDLDPEQTIRLIMNRRIDFASLSESSVFLADLDGAMVSGVRDTAETAHIVTWRPLEPLWFETTYTINVNSRLLDAEGTPFDFNEQTFPELEPFSAPLTTTGPGSTPPDMVLIPAGSFIMGDGDTLSYCGKDEREVTLTRDFYLGQHEVTNQRYMEALQWAYDHGYVTATISRVWDNLDGSAEELLDLDGGDCEISFSDGTFALSDVGLGINPSHPVKEVTWYGAARYCDWLSLQAGFPRAYEHGGDWSCNGGDPYGAEGYRLPTDAEWEYAAQWDDERIYPWGDEVPGCSRANFYSYSDCVGWTSPVGSYPDAPDALGLSDMAGNVFEWCNDWYTCNLGTSPQTDPVGPGSGSYRVFRGGCWYGNSHDLRCASRTGNLPISSNAYFGFRVAISP